MLSKVKMMGQIDASPAVKSNMEQTKLTASAKQETLKQTNNEQMKKRKSLPSNKKPILKDKDAEKTEASEEKVEKEKVEEKSGEMDEKKEEQGKDRAKVSPHLESLGRVAKQSSSVAQQKYQIFCRGQH